jgi:hypothetical protein
MTLPREKKFRAWDNVKDRMYYVGEESDISFSFDSNGIVATDIAEDFFEFKTLHHLAYMQYTGLYDRHGDKAAHKDIVEYEGTNYLIEWWEEDTGFYLAHLNYLDDLESEYHLKGQCIRESEIIGNAFEHPHLLPKEEEPT